MNFRIKTRYEELSMAVTIETKNPIRIQLKVYDEAKPKTLFTDRYKTISGRETLYVRMPITSDNIVVSVYNADKGNRPAKDETDFKVLQIEKLPLVKRMDSIDISNQTIANFVDFAQRFSFNASYLKPETYQSKDGMFYIEYLPQIIGSRGQILTTPARISKSTGKIQVSKKLFDNYTLPMRMAILLHEFSHFYLNENINDEVEADLNGLLIYLGLGYPRIEGYQAFLEVFKDSPSMQNKNRYDIINNFIRDFEKQKMVMY